MSYKVTQEIIRKVSGHECGGISPKLLLICLASFADEKRECFPSIPLLASIMGCDTRTVRRAIRMLSAAGFLGVYKNRGRSNYYKLRDDYTPLRTQSNRPQELEESDPIPEDDSEEFT